MSTENETNTEGTELAPGDVTDFIIALTQLDKGRVQCAGVRLESRSLT